MSILLWAGVVLGALLLGFGLALLWVRNKVGIGAVFAVGGGVALTAASLILAGVDALAAMSFVAAICGVASFMLAVWQIRRTG